MKKIYIAVILILVFKVTSFSQGWIDLNINPLPAVLNSVSTISHNVVWTGGFQGTVMYSSNAGVSWTNHGGGALGTMSIYSIMALDQNIALCGATGGGFTHIFRTTNVGASWFAFYNQANGFIDDIKFINSLTGYAYGDPVGGRWTFIKTINGGISWDTNSLRFNSISGEIGFPNAMFVYSLTINQDIIWFGTNNSRIYRSTNSGVNWSSIPVPQTSTYGISFFDANTGLICGNSQIHRTTNGGITWSGGLLQGSGPVLSVANNSGRAWCTRGDSIFFSTNQGVSFSFQHKSPGATSYRHISFALTATNDRSIIGGYAITGETFVGKYDDNTIGIETINDLNPDHFYLSQNYPNPFNPSTKIRFALPPVRSYVNIPLQLKIFDIFGKEVAKLVNQALSPGTYEVEWDASINSSGVYFYSLYYGAYKETKKMLLIK
jgi:photosystem II stability/assembly factor-like uncharacterized protein